jgi:ACT domain-containing protein
MANSGIRPFHTIKFIRLLNRTRDKMRVSMDIELKDVPGQMLLALQPLSEYKANLITVLHHHQKRTPRKTVPVQLVLEAKPENIGKIKAKLEESGVRVVRVGEQRFRESINVVLIGHVVHTGIQDTIDEIDKTGFAEVVDLTLSMPGINVLSSALIKIDAVGKQELKKALDILKAVSVKKDLLMVLPIDIQT